MVGKDAVLFHVCCIMCMMCLPGWEEMHEDDQPVNANPHVDREECLKWIYMNTYQRYMNNKNIPAGSPVFGISDILLAIRYCFFWNEQLTLLRNTVVLTTLLLIAMARVASFHRYVKIVPDLRDLQRMLPDARWTAYKDNSQLKGSRDMASIRRSMSIE